MTNTKTSLSRLRGWLGKRRRHSGLFDMTPYQLDDLGLSGIDISDALERRPRLFWSRRREN